MKIQQTFQTEQFADSLIKNLKEKKNIVASKEKTDDGFLISYDVELKEIKASSEGEISKIVNEAINDAVGYLYNEILYQAEDLRYEIDYLHQVISRHMDGHLPKVNGVEQMKRAVDALGLSDEYEVEKKYIWASKSGKGIDSLSVDVK